jgi:hypothetical protein
MLRCAMFAVAVVAVVAIAPAADPAISGKWMLTNVNSNGDESVVCILKAETKDGKPTASVLFAPQNTEITVSEFKATETSVQITLKQVTTIRMQKATREIAFVGTPTKDGKVILGSTGDYRFRSKAKLTATDKEMLEAGELTIKSGSLPEGMKAVQDLNLKVNTASVKAAREKDAEKKKELQKEFAEARKEADEKIPALYREVIEKNADSPAAVTAASALIRTSAKLKMTAAEAEKLVHLILKQSAPYGPLYTGVTFVPLAETLVTVKGLEPAALQAIEPAAKAITDNDPLQYQSDVLGVYKTALEKTGNAAEAKSVAARWNKVEGTLDTEFLAKVPPFKPETFAGRKDKSANQVVVMELFTGAQCPPCVAADVAFDALQKSFKPTDVILLQYHMHIPGPDPLTNPMTVARWDYYVEEFPTEIRGTPSTLFNGMPKAGGGGGMMNSEGKYTQYSEIIKPMLEKTTDVKVVGKAARNADKIDIAVEVDGADGKDMKLRLLVVEESVKYVGGNGLRFHHQVVRAMPDGAAGVVVNDKNFKHTAAVNLADVRTGLTKYLDEFAENRPFPKADRPMDMKTLRVVALVQNDKTREIVQAALIEVEGKAVGGGGE